MSAFGLGVSGNPTASTSAFNAQSFFAAAAQQQQNTLTTPTKSAFGGTSVPSHSPILTSAFVPSSGATFFTGQSEPKRKSFTVNRPQHKLSAPAPFQTASHFDTNANIDNQSYDADAGDAEVDGTDEAEEAEIARLEAARQQRTARFHAPSVSKHAPSSSHSHSTFTQPKLAVARAAGIIDDSSDGMEEADELFVVDEEHRIKGLCSTMCPVKELIDRIDSHQVSPFELAVGVNSFNVSAVSEVKWPVKRYRRAAAAQQIDPHDVRTHDVLYQTCQHLIDNVVDRADQPWHEVHRFVTDRFRACRADFVCQGLHTAETIQCYEWMVRFHIIAFHELIDEPPETFDPIQNMEKLTQTLTSLRLFYRDQSVAATATISHNQNEMLGYLLLTNFSKSFLPSYLSLPPVARQSSEVQFAYSVYQSAKEDNYAKFFALLRKANYLQSCLMLSVLPSIRRKAVQILSRSYHHYPLSDLTHLLCIDSDEATLDMLDWFGISVSDGDSDIVFTSGRTGQRQAFTDNPNGEWTHDRADKLLAAKRPMTKRAAIRDKFPIADMGVSDSGSTGVTSTAPASTRPCQFVSSSSSSVFASKLTTTSSLPAASSFFHSKASTFAAPELTKSNALNPFAASFTPTPPQPQPQPQPSRPSQFIAPPSSTTTIDQVPDVRSEPVRLKRGRAEPELPTANTTKPTPVIAGSSTPTPIGGFPTPAPSAFSASTAAAGRQPVTIGSARVPTVPFTQALSATFTPAPTATPAPPTVVTIPPSSSFVTHSATFKPLPSDDRVKEAASAALRQQQERQRLEAETERKRIASIKQQELERSMERRANVHYRRSLMIRMQQQFRASLAVSHLHRQNHSQAAQFRRQALLLSFFLQWHGQFVIAENERVSQAEMRAAMSASQYRGLMAMSSGLNNLITLNKLIIPTHPITLSTPVTQPSPVTVNGSHDETFVLNGTNDASLSAETTGSRLDVPALVSSIMRARNPHHAHLFFHLILDVANLDAPHAVLVRRQLGVGDEARNAAVVPYHPRTPSRLLLTTSASKASMNGATPNHSPAPRAAANGPLKPSCGINVRIALRDSESKASAVLTGYQAALFLIKPFIEVADLPQLLANPIQPPLSTAYIQTPLFAEERARFNALVSSLHRSSHLPVLVVYALGQSAIKWARLQGSDAADRLHAHVSELLTSALRLDQRDQQRVADVAITPLFIPANLRPAHSTDSQQQPSPFAHFRVDHLVSGIQWLAQHSPPHPSLHAVNVVDVCHQRVQQCQRFLSSVVRQLDAVISTMSAVIDTSPLVEYYHPQRYIEHFNRSCQSLLKRLINGLRDLSWPPQLATDATNAVLAKEFRFTSPSSEVARRLRALMSKVSLPDFQLATNTSVIELAPSQSLTAIAAYLADYQSLRLTVDVDDDDETMIVHHSSGEEIAALLNQAQEVFSQSSRSRTINDHRQQALHSWHTWLVALYQFRLRELASHPAMVALDDDAILLSVSEAELVQHTGTDYHNHQLQHLLPAANVDSSKLLAEPVRASDEAAPTLQVKRKAVNRDDADSDVVHSSEKRARPTSLLSELQVERERHRQLDAMLDQLERVMQRNQAVA